MHLLVLEEKDPGRRVLGRPYFDDVGKDVSGKLFNDQS